MRLSILARCHFGHGGRTALPRESGVGDKVTHLRNNYKKGAGVFNGTVRVATGCTRETAGSLRGPPGERNPALGIR
jgi:hypothetical protein